MEFLASDALNGRGSGTRDEWIAAQYIASQFRLWGLEPMGDEGGYVQTIEMGFTEAVPTITAGSLRFVHGKDMLVTLGTWQSASGGLQKQPGAQSGSIVLLTPGATVPAAGSPDPTAVYLSPETPQIRARWDVTAARLPRLTAARAVKLPALQPAGTANAPMRPARITLSTDAYDALSRLPEGTPIAFEANPRPGQTFTWNTLGRLTGSDPALGSEVVVLSAHMDHIGARPPQPGVDTINNGADDDASGTVAVMALAEALARGPRPKRTIVFALFGSEESGGYGAGFFVDLPVVPLDRLVADLQFEMLGRPDPKIPPNHLWLTGYERSNLGAELAKQGAALVADPHPDQSFFTRSDNIRFARRGIVAHTVSSYNLHKEYHTAEDEIRLIDFPYMTASIKSLVEPIRWLANAPFKPAWNPGGCPSPCK
jgi:Zn-dependent M28 family amino/carboxypeptidase